MSSPKPPPYSETLRCRFRLARSPLDILIAMETGERGLRSATSEQLREWSSSLTLAVRRERAKASMRHWSYDLNRHIVLKRAGDRLRDELARRKGERI